MIGEVCAERSSTSIDICGRWLTVHTNRDPRPPIFCCCVYHTCRMFSTTLHPNPNWFELQSKKWNRYHTGSEPLPYRFGTATIPVRNRYHTSSIASEEVETSFLVVKKGSMDGSVMSDVIDGENIVEIFRDTSKSSQNLFDNEHLFFLVVKCARRCTIHIRQTVHKNLHSAHKNDPSLTGRRPIFGALRGACRWAATQTGWKLQTRRRRCELRRVKNLSIELRP